MGEVQKVLDLLRDVALDENGDMTPRMIEAAKAKATIGEICGVLKEVFDGKYGNAVLHVVSEFLLTQVWMKAVEFDLQMWKRQAAIETERLLEVFEPVGKTHKDVFDIIERRDHDKPHIVRCSSSGCGSRGLCRCQEVR